jgi:ABC-2 type transport system permease protein
MNAVVAKGLPNTPFAWLLKREVWETKAVWVAPLICAAVLVVSTIVGTLQIGDLQINAVNSPEVVEKFNRFGADGVSRLAALLLLMIAMPFYVAMSFTQFFYAMDALYSDRRDRSVLFWKSLPVSDAETVLSKVVTGTVVIPLVAFAVAVVGQLAVYAVLSVKLAGTDLPFTQYMWNPQTWLPALVTTLYATVAVMIWSVPLVGWLLFVSAISPRSPFLWATLPPLALALAERVIFGTAYFAMLLKDRTFGVFEAAFGGFDRSGFAVRIGSPGELPPTVLSLIRPVEFLTNPIVWGGLAVGAAFVAAAVWARRYRDETT